VKLSQAIFYNAKGLFMYFEKTLASFWNQQTVMLAGGTSLGVL
jgi:hypothetical protein